MPAKILNAEIPGAPEIAGESKPRRSTYFLKEPLTNGPPGAATAWESFIHGLKASGGNSPCFGTRPIIDGVPGPFVWQTYNEVAQRVNNLGYYFHKIGLKSQDFVGLFSINRAEWVIAEQASFSFNLCTVPLYDTLGAEAVEFIIQQTELTLCVATKDKASFLLDLINGESKDKLKSLKFIVVMDGASNALVQRGADLGVTVISQDAAEEIGSKNPAEQVPPATTDLATICYTSGTTGLPKGVCLTHGNMVSFCGSAFALIGKGRLYEFSKDDVYLSYLPLAHVFERACMTVILYCGARVGFYQGDTLKLLEDVAELKPTVFASVPRLYNRVYDRVLAGVKAKGGIAKMLFDAGFAAKKKGLASGQLTHWLWDRLVFSTVRARLGGRVRVMLTGAAPISADVIDFLRICFSCELYEGYGQTETAAALTAGDRGDFVSGNVGAILPCAEVKLIDVPSMGYTSKDKPFPRGEICVRGTNVFQGYYKSPEKTAETIDKDGWAHTGDIGTFDENGRLVIIDRVKNIFKLAQGEYIAPEKIETVLNKNELVAQSFVYGDSLQAVLVAVCVPGEEVFEKWANSKFGEKPLADHCKSPEVRKALLKELETYGKQNGLKGFENVKNVFLDPVPFSMDNGLFTPTFKLKRHEAKLYYQKQIDAMYAELERK